MRIKDSLGDFVWKRTKRSPMILPIIVEVEAQETIDTAKAAQMYENGLYTRNARPVGILKTDSSMNKEAKDKIREEWHKIHEGVDNAFRIAVLDLGIDYKPISVSNKDTQFVESKAVSVEDIARISFTWQSMRRLRI